MNYTQSRQTEGAQRYAEMMRAEGIESISGPGSSIEATAAVREWLPDIINQHRIRSVADIPCGDHNWLATIELPNYAGYDVVPDAIQRACARRPDRTFGLLNAIIEPAPRVDLIICRDLLVHLKFADALAVLTNFRQSGSRFVALTDFPDESRNRELSESHPGWGWRPLNMHLAPFGMSPRLETICEDDKWRKYLTLFPL